MTTVPHIASVRSRHLVSLMVVCLAGSGASCPSGIRSLPTNPAPVAFNTVPTWEQVVSHLNTQTQRVRTIQTTAARLNVEGAPALSTSLALQRPRSLRMQSGLGLTGAELDLGSNDDEFWFWAKRQEPPGVYFARHADLGQLGSSGFLPVPPSWLIEALGLIEIDPASPHDGPRQLPDGRLELRVQASTPQGPLLKVLMVDGTNGALLEQNVFDAAGKAVATARASRHQYDPNSGVTLPQHVEVDLPGMPLRFTLDVEGFSVNQEGVNAASLYVKPEYPGYPPIHLSQVPLASREPRVGWRSGAEFMRGR